MWGCGLLSIVLGYGSVADSSQDGNEPPGSIKCGEFLDQLSEYQICKKGSALKIYLTLVYTLKVQIWTSEPNNLRPPSPPVIRLSAVSASPVASQVPSAINVSDPYYVPFRYDESVSQSVPQELIVHKPNHSDSGNRHMRIWCSDF